MNRYKYSDANVEKSDYLRWRQVSLSYNIPTSILSKIRISSASLTLSMSNIGLLWKANKAGLDPDYASGLYAFSLPPKKAYSLGLNINF